MNENNGRNESERDDFWDIDKLVPKKSTSLRSFATGPVTVTYDVDREGGAAAPSEPEESKNERKLTFPRHAPAENTADDESYTPEGNRFIKKVTIKRSSDKYDFYGSFRKAALIYYDYKTQRCDYTPFFSYMPQYSQMSAEQKNYYFYWRSEIRRGKFPKTDYSYLYLFVYEILNLPDKIPAEEGIRMLCSLWRAYRSDLPKIGANFSVWIQDYCLIHRLPCPTDGLRDFMFEAIASSSFKEFYLSDFENAGIDSVSSMLAFLSDYDWKKGKFIEEAVSEVYKKHMLTAMKGLLLHLVHCGELYNTATETAVIKRNAFPNSLCTHSVKCRLEIEYISLAGKEELRVSITAAVRYTENKIRALLGVKSRLAVKELPDKYREIIDAYFVLASDRDERIRAKEQIPEYERLYDAPSEGLSFEGADEIERASWATTQRLVAEEDACDFEEEKPEEELSPSINKEAFAPVASDEADTYGLSSRDIAILSGIISGESDLGCDGLALEAAVERINEAFSDAMGDVVLYHDGERYAIYDDYTEEIGEWLLKLTK